MQKLVQYRGNESICRQRAVFDFENRWRWLAEAEMWAHRAQDEIAARFMECTSASPIEVVRAQPKVAA
jgi:hypothetical protein